MTERRVNVRIAGIGGDQLKAALVEIGATGDAALAKLATGSGPATVGLQSIDRAATAANVEMKSMHERMALTSASLRAAALGSAEVAERMRAAGVEARKFRNAAEELDVYSRAVDNLRAKHSPLYAAQRQFQSVTEEIRQAQVAGALSVDEMTAALEREALAYEQSVAAIQKRQAAQAAEVASRRGPSLADQINARTGVTGGTARDPADVQAYGKALDDLRARHNPLFAVIRQYKATQAELRQAHAVGALSIDEYTAAMQRERQAALQSIDVLKGRVQHINDVSTGANIASYRMSNLAFQINDIGVSAVSGMSPFMILAQQGTQIAQIYGFERGGVNALMSDLGMMVRNTIGRFPALAAAIGLGTIAVGGLRSEIEESTGVAVTWGDTIMGVFDVVTNAIGTVLRPLIDGIAPWFQAAWDAVVAGIKWVGNALINGIRLAVAGIAFAVDTIPTHFEGAFNLAVAAASYAMSDIVGVVNAGLGKVSEGLNAVFGTEFGAPLDNAVTFFDRMGNDAMTRADALRRQAMGEAGAFAGRASEIMGSDPMGAFFDQIAGAAAGRANARNEAEAEGGGGGGGGGGAAEVAEQAEVALQGWDAVADAVGRYATEAMDWGTQLGQAFTSAFGAAENAFGEFVKTGKVDFRELTTSIIADLAKIAARRFILGPLANAFMGFLGPLTSPAAVPSFAGGGHTGFGARAGGLDGQGGFLAMLHPRERVVDETKAGRGGNVYVTIQTQDVNSFRRSRAQVASDVQRMVAQGRRGM